MYLGPGKQVEGVDRDGEGWLGAQSIYFYLSIYLGSGQQVEGVDGDGEGWAQSIYLYLSI